MLTGCDPGTLGLYGFRDRRSRRYGDWRLASSQSIRVPRVWDVLGEAGLASILVGVPQTYPAPKLRGVSVGCFLTPSGAGEKAMTAGLYGELVERFGEPQFDIEGFRGAQREGLLDRIYAKTHQDFAIARHLLDTREWQFFMMVVMGTDRLHHAFWPPAATPADDAAWQPIYEFYRFLDQQIGELLLFADEDDRVVVVSDHGAKPLQGGFRLNQWLMDQGLLVLKTEPDDVVPLDPSMVDWPKTRVWADGGYCGRLFLNVRDREPEGCVPPAHAEGLLGEVGAELEAMRAPDGRSLGTRVLRPCELYRTVNGIAPDALAYLGNLDWRALASVGGAGWYSAENDTGHDGANHDWRGIYIERNSAYEARGQRAPQAITDIGPQLLAGYGLGFGAGQGTGVPSGATH